MKHFDDGYVLLTNEFKIMIEYIVDLMACKFRWFDYIANKMKDSALDFICGYVSGCMQVLVQQPFDLVKVRIVNQSLKNPQYHGIWDCFRKIRAEQGLLAFYKGSLSPLLGVGVQVAVQFSSNQLFKKLMRSQSQTAQGRKRPVLSIQNVILAGILTGIPSSLVVTPIDHTRILVQIQHGDNANSKYHGSIDAGRVLLRKHGIQGLYHGYFPTLLRQIIAMPTYFSSHEFGMRKLSPDGKDSSKAPLWAAFLMGGFSGMLSWLVNYPIDYIKTVVQSDDVDNRKYKSAIDCARKCYVEEGLPTFFKGLGVSLVRSYPVNGVAFLSFELMRRITGRKQHFN